MNDLLQFFMGLLAGSVLSAIVAYFFLLRDHQLQAGKVSEAAQRLPYSIEQAWRYLSCSKLINCYKTHESEAGYGADVVTTDAPEISSHQIIADRPGGTVFINHAAAPRSLEYGLTPFESSYFFRLYRLSENETLIVCRRTVTPEDLLDLPFRHKLLALFDRTSPYQPQQLAAVSLATISYGMQRHYG